MGSFPRSAEHAERCPLGPGDDAGRNRHDLPGRLRRRVEQLPGDVAGRAGEDDGAAVGHPARPSIALTCSGVRVIRAPSALLRIRSSWLLLGITTNWCATCQANKKLVFHSDDVLKEFAAKKVVTLRADWTNKDPRITAELARYHRSAVPFNLVWLPGHDEPRILPELLTPSIVLQAVR